ncbi:LysR substrate-binding domain-containing protein [Shimia sp.]|uniref:LysR substrate-binding domain-containing protein n=1 Tax=Shimia sp. TaxID=1954381 RepID=UPI003299589F
MDWSGIPPLNALRAFSALASCGSYTDAGAALNVTHAAIVQQVRSLEERLDLKLVNRVGRNVVLTEDGQTLARHLSSAFHHIRAGVEELSESSMSRPVKVTMSPAFAAKWLMPRLAEFRQIHPEVTLLLDPSGEILDLRRNEIDVALRYSRRRALPKGVDVIVSGDLAVIGTSDFLGDNEMNETDLLHLPWLQELGTNEVDEVLSRLGVQKSEPPTISHMPGNLVMDAVQRGDGITYTLCEWLQDDLDSGQLVARYVEKDEAVFYIQTQSDVMRPAVHAFIKWLKRQASPRRRQIK